MVNRTAYCIEIDLSWLAGAFWQLILNVILHCVGNFHVLFTSLGGQALIVRLQLLRAPSWHAEAFSAFSMYLGATHHTCNDGVVTLAGAQFITWAFVRENVQAKRVSGFKKNNACGIAPNVKPHICVIEESLKNPRWCNNDRSWTGLDQ